MGFIVERLETILSELTSDFEFCVAFSGGLDSCVLLHALHQLTKQHPTWQLRAIHVHHGLQARAEEFAKHCQQVADTLHIPIHIERLQISIKPGKSLEAEAREARYQVFQQQILTHENVLTAHTADDQVETVFLQLLRGAGVKGLSAMPAKKKLGMGLLLRPLLEFSREDLEHYAGQHRLSWIEDPTNHDLRFNRNYLRHEVLPILKRRWPSLLTTVSRVAQHCQEAALLLDKLADETIGSDTSNLSVTHLAKLSLAEQRNVLRRWIDQQGFALPTAEQMEHIIKNVLAASEQSMPLVHWEGADLRRYQGKLYLMLPLSAHPTHACYPWNLENNFQLPGSLGHLQATATWGQGLSPSIDRSQITVRFRQGGERIRLQKGHTHELKKLMQAFGIPPWQRNRVPLIFVGDALAMVVGYAISVDYCARSHEMGWSIDLIR